MNSCAVCLKRLTKKQNLQCGFCQEFLHISCANIDEASLAAMKSVPYLTWKCHKCYEKTSADDEEVIQNVPDSKSCEGCKILPALQASIVALTNAVKALEAEIKDIKKEKMEEKSGAEIIINEIMEREERSKNIILFNLEEKYEEDKMIMKEHDIKMAKKVIREICPDLDTNNIKTFRIGKKNGANRRALKVCLNNKGDAMKIIKNKKKLRDSNSTVSIVLDQTTMQRDYYRKIQDELNNRKENGESNLFIKYENGIPKISKKYQPNPITSS